MLTMIFAQVGGRLLDLVQQALVAQQVGDAKLKHAGLPGAQHLAGPAQLQVFLGGLLISICTQSSSAVEPWTTPGGWRQTSPGPTSTGTGSPVTIELPRLRKTSVSTTVGSIG